MVDAADIGRGDYLRSNGEQCFHLAGAQRLGQFAQQRIGARCPATHERIGRTQQLEAGTLEQLLDDPVEPLAVLQAARGLKDHAQRLCRARQPRTGRLVHSAVTISAMSRVIPDMRCRAFSA